MAITAEQRTGDDEVPEPLPISPSATGSATATSPPTPDPVDPALHVQDDLYRLLVGCVQDYAIFALDPGGHVRTWNLGAERLKGYTVNDILGKHFSIFYEEEERARGKPEWELEVATLEERFEDEGWRVRKDGSRFWASVIITAIRDGDGNLVGFGKVTRDLTERRAAEQRAIEDARRVAASESANRAKSTFLAAMSHELRTPLNAIAGYADLLAAGIGGGVSEQQLAFLKRIRTSQQHLLSIINDLLNLSKIEAGQLSYSRDPVVLNAVVADAIPMVEPQAAARSVTVGYVEECEAVALADGPKVEQILLNLLSNAVKFTPPGGSIRLSCGVEGERVTLKVSDTGSGIAPEHLEAIFEPFVQVGRSLVNPHEGTGLGLAISRDLARGMGGSLHVESTPGEGSTFVLTLPAFGAATAG